MGVDVFRIDEVFRIGVPLNRKEKEPDLLGEEALVGLVGLGLSKELPRGRLGGVVYSAIFVEFSLIVLSNLFCIRADKIYQLLLPRLANDKNVSIRIRLNVFKVEELHLL